MSIALLLSGGTGSHLGTACNDLDEVLVAVKATSICESDIPRIHKTGAHIHPLIPGHEFPGVAEAIK